MNAQFEKVIEEIKTILIDQIIGIIIRPDRWGVQKGEARQNILIVVWDSSLSKSISLYQVYAISAGLRLQSTDIIGLSQFDLYVQNGVPAYIFAAVKGKIQYDPNGTIAEICKRANTDEHVNTQQLSAFLEQKSQGHFDNVEVTLQRLLAEIYLGFEAGTQAKWLDKQNALRRLDILEVSTWEQLKNHLRIPPNIAAKVTQILNDLIALRTPNENPMLGQDMLDAYRELRNASISKNRRQNG
jgi:hypothetical protein